VLKYRITSDSPNTFASDKITRLKTLFFIGILIWISTFTYSQSRDKEEGKSRIVGRVIDSLSASPLEYATITLLQPGKTRAVNGTTTDESGHFNLEEVLPGDYLLVVEFIGYGKTTKNLSI